MKDDELIEAIDRAMNMREAELRQEFSEETIRLANVAINSMIHTIALNVACHGHKQPGLEFGQTICCALALLRTLDAASDHVAGVPNQQN